VEYTCSRQGKTEWLGKSQGIHIWLLILERAGADGLEMLGKDRGVIESGEE